MLQPDFENLAAVLHRQCPARPTLFEFFLNGPLVSRLSGEKIDPTAAPLEIARIRLKAFTQAGYDYLTLMPTTFAFPNNEFERKESISLNAGNMIGSEDDFERYDWPDPEDVDYGMLDALQPDLPGNMKLIAYSPGGLLENAIALVGYESLCFLLVDEPELVGRIFDAIGSRLVRYYELCLAHDSVGAVIVNDDWGFKTQTMLSVEQMRTYVIPWHGRMVEAAHAAGRPAILHSCGQLEKVMDDIIDVISYDGKHSWEDAICPVEDAYDRWADRIAILGGIDMDYICRRTPEEVAQRSRAMLERSETRGGYALGTGNSVPEYVPMENYFAMIRTARPE